MKRTTYVFGHKNPDTDSVVSAAAFARLKNLLGETEYKAARAGKLSPQTEYIFRRFNTSVPEYIPDLIPKTKYYMHEGCKTVCENCSLWEAASVLQNNEVKVLPVVDADGKYTSLLHYDSFSERLLGMMNPLHHMNVYTNISLVKNTLNAQVISEKSGEEIEKYTVLLAAGSFESFKSSVEAHINEKLIVIAGDREEIQDFAVENKVRFLILTAGRIPSREFCVKARASGTSVLVSSFDSASTVMLVLYSMPVSVISDYTVKPVYEMDTVQKIRPLLFASPSRSLPVVDDKGCVLGIISEGDLLQEACIQVSLVDHNERTQAPEGIEFYRIREIIDHHRIGSITTKNPILFMNSPVGSTATIITNMYREQKIAVPLDIAQILLCGILSDTLILQSATTTETDRETAEYLSGITDLDINKLGQEIIAAGSMIEGRTASQIIGQDMKEYHESDCNFTVSQIEVDDPDEILHRKEEIMTELEITRRSRSSLFSALLVTDITTLSSIMLLSGDDKFMSCITFPEKEKGIYFLKDVVSRKKQLIPLLTELISHSLM